MAQKQFAVLGLGVYGSTIVKTLKEYNCDVIAIDLSRENVERVTQFCDNAIQADFTDIEQLKDCGVENVDTAIVAQSKQLDASILAVMNLKELGIPHIVAKAKNKVNLRILEKIGADRVVRPEKEMGEKTAKQILSRNVREVIDIDDEYSMVLMQAPKSWIGKTIAALDVRNKLGMNIIGLRVEGVDKLDLSFSADYVVCDDDKFMVIAESKVFEEMEYNGLLV
ncbi:MAG: potassium channel family protein [Erysipelotrichaceae bacterium]